MENIFAKLAGEDSTSNKIDKKNKSKSLIRGNVDLLNMLLGSDNVSQFVDPFKSSYKTFSTYKKQAATLKKLGVISIEKYNKVLIEQLITVASCIDESLLMKLICTKKTAMNELDFIQLISDVSKLQKLTSGFYVNKDGRISFNEKSLSFDEIIYSASNLYKVHHLSKRSLDEPLKNTVLRITNPLFTKTFNEKMDTFNAHIHCEKEKGINRKFLFEIRSMAMAIIQIQTEYIENPDEILFKVNPNDIIWSDRLTSSILSL